ncbi:putative GOLD domain superfamily protein [Helianthus anomalus]
MQTTWTKSKFLVNQILKCIVIYHKLSILLQKCTIVWELRVVGWEVSYSAEYVPNDETNYTINIQKPKKMTAIDEPVISQSFKIKELGKILLTIDNPTSKKKTLLYRFKVDPLSE